MYAKLVFESTKCQMSSIVVHGFVGAVSCVDDLALLAPNAACNTGDVARKQHGG